MTRDAKLYILTYKDWNPLSELLQKNIDYTLKDDVTIFQLMASTNTGQHYAILTLSDRADKIVEEYGGILASENDLLRKSLHSYSGEPLFGDKTNVTFLNKI